MEGRELWYITWITSVEAFRAELRYQLAIYKHKSVRENGRLRLKMWQEMFL